MEFWQNLELNEALFHTLKELLIVVGIGLLLGLEREFTKSGNHQERLFAGIRTFAIVTLMGYLALYLSNLYSIWIFIATLGGVIVMIALSYQRTGKQDFGTTTEFALLIAYLLGALVFTGNYHLAVSITVIVTALLALKTRMHDAVQRLSQPDILSILIFIVITALVLPLLPNQNWGPYGILNLYEIWLIVVIFVTLNFAGYFLTKFLDQKKSTLMTGILGGFVSSTATTWYFSRQSGKSEEGGVIEAAAIILASSIMFPRLLIWLLLLNFPLFKSIWWFVLLLGLVGIGFGYWIARKQDQLSEGPPKEVRNPINLREALIFALIYLAIQFVVGYANAHFGENGVYLASGISGITDIDAITISMANFSKSGLAQTVAGTAILIAAFANTLIKFIFCLFFGNKRLKRYTSMVFVPLFAIGIGYIVFRLMG
ncbi:MAG: MgtC/SapB family protein [Lewinellaceae bacterium]|nr:MgtC/SapB family protein [Lewinellaceae bacterium]